jgi:hypothetical protein
MMIRFVRLLAAAALAAGLAAASPAANAQTGPQDEGAVQTTGPLGSPTLQKAKPRQTALKKRAARRPAAPEGRQITVHARPSWLTAGTQAPVGTVGNGYVYSTFDQPTPIEGTFMGMRGRERLTDPAPGLTLFRF